MLVLGAWCCVYVLVLGAGAVSDWLLVLCPGAGVDGRGRESVSELKYRDEEILLQTFMIIPIYLFGLL